LIMVKMLSIKGNPLIGLYMRATEHFAVLGIDDKKAVEYLRDELDVDVVITTISGSELVGSLIAANSRGIIVSDLVRQKEIERLKRITDVYVIRTPMTCLGNITCINDRGAIMHPEAEDKIIESVSEFLDVDVIRSTIGGIKTVGMAAVITNRGGILNPNASEWEIKKAKEVMKVEVGTGTVNFGVDMVGTGLVANSKGYIVGKDTTGFELGVIEESLFP